MSNRKNTFDVMIAGLRGRACENTEWGPIIALANHTLLTPALYASLILSQEIDKLPEDLRAYLLFVAECNQERNRRLRVQLYEAVAALNALNITPLLLKGAVPLYLNGSDHLPSRITSDLDVAVDKSEMEAAQTCLETLGYTPVDGFRGMARPEDVGLFELRPKHEDPSGALSVVTKSEGVITRIPTPIARAQHWLLHDLIKEGDYIRGRIDLRHLHDLAELSSDSALDWSELRAQLPDQTSRNAVDVQLLALHDLFGVAVPLAGLHRPSIRFHHWRRTFSARHPFAAAPLRVFGNLAWGLRRLPRLKALAKKGPLEAARRILRVVFQLRPRAKL